MADAFRPPARPTWYRRLPPALQRVAAASDRVPSLPLAAGSALREAVGALPAAQAVAERIGNGVCAALRVPAVVIRVELKRPATRRGELHGLYTPANGHGRDAIRLWMITAKRGQVVAYRTFLRTLLHEICHHLDYTYLHLRDSLHTQGFYQRESSLFHALGAGDVDSA